MSSSLPEAAALAGELAAARWYGGKGAAIVGVDEDDRLELGDGVCLHVLRVRADGRADERYLYLTGEGRLAEPLLQAMAEGRRSGDWVFQPGAMLPQLLPRDGGQRPIGSDQSNTTLVAGERLALKLYRRLEPGPHPDVELGRFLTEQAGLDVVPAYAGCLNWGEHAIAMLQAYVPDAEEGWRWGSRAVQEGDVADIAQLGAVTARLHAALAGLEQRPATSAELRGWREAADLQLDRALVLVDADTARELERYAGRLRDEFAALEASPPPQLSRVHGDYHIGQVLRSAVGLRVVDFEGEPTRSLAERNALGTPLRDVAAMLRSFDHLARHVDRDLLPGHADAIEAWIGDARDAFLDAYGPHDPALLRGLEAEKETYEFIYAATFLPEWMYAPVGGMRWLMAAAR